MIQLGRGPREVEELLLQELVAAVSLADADPKLLARPLRVLVPSRSLRRHVAARVARHFGRGVAGLEVQTLHSAALEVLERAGAPGLGSDALYPVIVRQLAREEPSLRAGLDDLVDGYRAVAEAVTDLLDAGLRAEHAEPLADALAEFAGDPATAGRARAVLRVATGVREALEVGGLGHPALIFDRAREILERDAGAALPARGIWIHGFAEATGLRSEFLAALVRCAGARVFLDEPPDPAAADGVALRRSFSDRLRARLEGLAESAVCGGPPPGPPRLEALRAPGCQAEVRAVAERIRRALDSGLRPEAIAVVSRDVGRYRAAIREQFRRLGIPFSGVGEAGSVGSARRRVEALFDLLAAGGRVPSDRWLDAVVSLGSDRAQAHRSDLRLALRHVAAVRLDDVAKRPPLGRELRLPAVGAWRDEDGEGGAAGVGRRSLPAEVHAAAVAAAVRAKQGLGRLRRVSLLGERLDALGALLANGLGWDDARPECAAVRAGLDRLRDELPDDFALGDDDFQLLLRRALADVGSEPIGGAGGGVQILSVMEARGRTFDLLFAVGMNRDVFPRGVHPDALLPDPVRRALAVILPDLPIKATGYDEDRYLFAQLMASSPSVVLSWQTVSDDGTECAPSTFIERMHWSPGDFAPVAVPPVAARPGVAGEATAPPALRTPAEAAVCAGLFGDRAAFAEALALACAEADGADDGRRSRRRAAAARGRLAVLEELDPERPGPGLGPYFGFAGQSAGAGDPRTGPLYVTAVEGVARCPWQAFLGRLLRLEAPPDPLEALPGGDARLLGNVVHAVLEGIVADAGAARGGSLDAARAARPVAVAWPAPDDLAARARAAAATALERDGIALRGLARVLAGQALPLLDRARARAFGSPASDAVLAAEVEGVLERGAGERPVHFRVDRVDAVEGGLLLTDYKTGRPISDAVKPATRRRKLVEAVERGASLQAAVYARAAGGAARGRFLFLGPDLAEDAAEFAVAAADADVRAAFDGALAAIEAAWDAGVVFPRLVEGNLEKENPACRSCSLATACLRGDSGARLRLTGWLESAAEASAAGTTEAVLLDLWRLSPARGAR